MKHLIRTLAGAAVLAITAAVVPATGGHATVEVIVRATSEGAAARSVVALGGSVERRLPLVDGVAAEVPRSRLARLTAARGVTSVTPNAGLRLLSDDDTTVAETGSLLRAAQISRATRLWRTGITGAGVDVALIDSGVAPVAGLGDDKVLRGPDLSFSAGDPTAAADGYGHGTHMAGIIGARDRLAPGHVYASGDAGVVGIAPDARVVSIKVANESGATDVSLVIAAIDWAITHRNRDGLNIRVLNLSFGTDGVQHHTLDPLTFAVEQAWHAGIVVVVAGGNDGERRTGLSNPARDPFVLAVAADDTKGTHRVDDDEVPVWSSRGDGVRNPDVVAPGRSLASLRAPGSTIDRQSPDGQVAGAPRFFKGSGTSQAAAVTSGLAALLLQARPELNPDQVKAALVRSARNLRQAPPAADGSGLVDVEAARSTSVDGATQGHERSSGAGSLDAARGSFRAPWSDDHPDHTAFGTPWSPDFMGGWSGGTWSGGTWSGGTWSGGTWSGGTWSGGTWSGGTWSGGTWSGGTWSGGSWS